MRMALHHLDIELCSGAAWCRTSQYLLRFLSESSASVPFDSFSSIASWILRLFDWLTDCMNSWHWLRSFGSRSTLTLQGGWMSLWNFGSPQHIPYLFYSDPGKIGRCLVLIGWFGSWRVSSEDSCRRQGLRSSSFGGVVGDREAGLRLRHGHSWSSESVQSSRIGLAGLSLRPSLRSWSRLFQLSAVVPVKLIFQFWQ